MADKKKKKQGGTKARRFGSKMAHPRIKTSKEKRRCGPIGYHARALEKGVAFTTRAAWIECPAFTIPEEH
jgi:hypothetical protein